MPDILYAIDDTKLYAAADANGKVIAVLTKGAPLEILNRSTTNTWLKVRSTENSQWVGYVPAASTSAKPVLQKSASNKQTSPKSTNDIAAIQQSRTQAEKDYLSAQTQNMLEYYESERERERQEEAEQEARLAEQQRLEQEDFQRRQDAYAEQRRRQSMADWGQRTQPSYLYNRQDSPSGRNRYPDSNKSGSIYEPVPQSQINAERNRALAQAQSQNTGSRSGSANSASSRSSASGREPSAVVELSPRPPVPQASSNCREVYPEGFVCARAGSPAWYAENQRDTAIGMARTMAFTDAASLCNGYRYQTPDQNDPAWRVANPDCRESYGHTTDGSALVWCEIEVAGPCTPIP
ncbi:SH3 domain-containing protein [Methylophaga lonarensis]|uniref:SH3 domain-containing protein n=1 Tax=Methylophaga lonarensis TaxID=999151 RepID=UPI003D26D922